MKRFLAILCAVVLVLSLSISVFAAEETTGSITVGKAVAGHTYTIYKMADLESYVNENDASAYSYKPVEAWKAFFTAKSDIFEISTEGYVTVKADVTVDTAQLAKDALAYAKEHNIAGTAHKVLESETSEGTVIFNNLDLGYYLVDSSMGTVCSLNTTDPNFAIEEKNAEPSVEKQVQEDSNSAWGEKNDADFYQTVNFKTTITAMEGAQGYILHDKMTGLDLHADKIVVYLNGEADANKVATTNYTVTTTGLTDGCTFEIVFTQAFCDTLKDNDKIIVTYSANLNENSTVAGKGNPNETWLNYGENNEFETNHDDTVTYVYEFDLVKTDSDNKLLDGAEFKLYDAATGGNEIPVVKEADGSYRLAKAGETGESIVVKDGKVTITGLDGGTTYYLEETVAPEGYNKLTTRKEFTIGSSNLSASYENEAYTAGTGVQVVNKTGAELPETGGFGTVLFTTVGTMLVLGAGVLLVTKRRAGEME